MRFSHILLPLLPLTNGCEYHLSQANGAVKVVYTALPVGNAYDYLTDPQTPDTYGTNGAEPLTSADTVQVTSGGIVLDTNWLTQIENNNGGEGVLLMEGCAPSTAPLKLEIWQNGQKAMEIPCYLSIGGVEQMFRHLNLSAYGNGSVEVASRYDAPNEPETQDKNLVFVHGYNVNQQQARGVESEMFKRFYWSGSKAKFYGVTWNGAVSQGDFISGISCNLQTNIVNALQTASHLADFLTSGLSGDTTVAAHSLGNMVVLSAISDYGATPGHYFMIDSAVPIEAIDGSVDTNPDMIHPDWADYTNRLYTSQWYNLWPSSDARSTLTWSNRLDDLGNVDIYNFYSSGEEVLRYFPGAPPNDSVSAILDIISEMSAGVDKAAFVWVWEEKNKGRMQGNDFIGSNHGGWKFNDVWYGTNFSDGFSSYYQHMSASSASLLLDSQLQTNAFFSFSSDINMSIPVFTADTALLGSSGSTYAAANRDRILSDAIPALTLPIGANAVTNLTMHAGSERNFNMQNEFETSWPSARTVGDEALKWHHTDFDYVAYPFTHKLFDEIVSVGNLK